MIFLVVQKALIRYGLSFRIETLFEGNSGTYQHIVYFKRKFTVSKNTYISDQNEL